MTIRGGISRKEAGPPDPSTIAIRASQVMGVLLSATANGRTRMQDGFFNVATALAKFATDSITNAVLLKAVVNGAFIANSATRALFANSFINTNLIADGAVTKAKLAAGFLQSTIISGGAAGAHTVTGIATTDSLVHVWEQDGTSGIITDRTSEFTISATNTINNGGGTSTSGDKLIILYLDLS